MPDEPLVAIQNLRDGGLRRCRRADPIVQSLEHFRLLVCGPHHARRVPGQRQPQAETCATGPVSIHLLDREFVGWPHEDDGGRANPVHFQSAQALQRPADRADGRRASQHDRNGQRLDECDLKFRLTQWGQRTAERLDEQATAGRTGIWSGPGHVMCRRNGLALKASRQERCHGMLEPGQGLMHDGPGNAHGARARNPNLPFPAASSNRSRRSAPPATEPPARSYLHPCLCQQSEDPSWSTVRRGIVP